MKWRERGVGPIDGGACPTHRGTWPKHGNAVGHNGYHSAAQTRFKQVVAQVHEHHDEDALIAPLPVATANHKQHRLQRQRHLSPDDVGMEQMNVGAGPVDGATSCWR